MKRENRYKLPNPMIEEKQYFQIIHRFAIILNLFQGFNNSNFIKKRAYTLSIFAVLLFFSFFGFSQSCLTSFNLNSPTLYSGTAKAVGAIYKFSNAAAGVDVHIRIDALNNASLDSMDLTGTGYTKAWQPQINFGSSGGYIDWTVSFKKAGTNTDTTVCVPVSAIDIDGGSDIQEYIQTNGYSAYYLGSPTNLTISNPGSGWSLKALGPTTTYGGIDVTATNVQIQVEFLNINTFVWRTGATNNQSRLFSLYFNTFLTCSNVSNGGTIGGNESACGTSFDPAILTNVTTPTGGSGTIEYRWLQNTVSANPTDANWQIIPSTNNATYDPSTISTTTHYKRQARRYGCAEWWESSNVVSKTLFATPIASIAATENACTANDDKVTVFSPVNLTASGGSTYVWNNSLGTGAAKTVSLLFTTTYTVTVTDVNGCTATASKTISVVLPPFASISATENSCTANDNKIFAASTVNLVANGGINYTWNNSLGTGASKSATPSVTTTYVVTVTDANGCTATANRTITIITPMSLSTSVTNVLCGGTPTGAINLTVGGGSSPLTYDWGGGITTEDRTNLAVGTYSVTVTDANGCTQMTSANVTQPATINASTSNTNILCNGGTTGAINLTASNGTAPYTYNWGGGVTTEDRTGLAAGTYNVTITDANGCTQTASATLTQATALAIAATPTNINCFGSSTGAINISVSGGTSPYTYNWDGGITSQNRTGLAAGTYNLTVTDANSCTKTTSITLTQPAGALTLSTSITNISCGIGTGAINLTASNGTSPYTYNWGGGVTTEDRTGLTVGTYTVTVTDANGCTATISPTVTQTTAATLTTSVANISCFGGTGAINLTATGGSPFTYNWGGGVTTEDRTGLAAGTYTVTVTNAQGCTSTTSATVTTPSVLALSATATNANCIGSSTGAINLTVAGGTSPYTYNWGGGVTTEDRSSIAAGIYTVTVTDVNGCTAILSRTITQPTALNLSTIITQVTCVGGSDGAIDLTVTGSTAPYTYNWGGGITTQDRTGLGAGTYSVTVTDANGCTATTGATLTAQNGAPNPPTNLRH